MRLLKNTFIIVFVLASIWVVKDDVINFVSNIISNTKNQNSESSLVNTDTNIPILNINTPKNVLPGPLVQIEDKSTNADKLNVFQNEIIALVNKERTSRGLKSYTENNKLDNSAKIKAEDMINKNYFEHVSPDGKSVSDLAKQVGYDYLSVGENLAKGNFPSSANLVTAWMNSPGHRANILNPKFTEIGVSVEFTTENGRDILYAVQHFGLPRSACGAVDQNLKKEIESMQQNLKEMEGSLIEQKNVIDDYGKNKLETKNYNELVDEYNNSIKIYNSIVGEIKVKVLIYNTQVKNLNDCISG